MIVAKSLRDDREIKSLYGYLFSMNICSTWKLYRCFIMKNSHLSIGGLHDHHRVNFQECSEVIQPIPHIRT